MLPVSQYEALLAEVRGLRRKAQRVQQLATPLISINCTSSYESNLLTSTSQIEEALKDYNYKMDVSGVHCGVNYICDGNNCDPNCGNLQSSLERQTEARNNTTAGASSSSSSSLLYHDHWPIEKVEKAAMWNSSSPPATSPSEPHQHSIHNVHDSFLSNHFDAGSVMSFESNSGCVPLDRLLNSPPILSRRSSQQLEAKVDMVYSLLAMLSGQEHADMGETLLALSTNPESCHAMRQSGCIPLLVQMVQSDREQESRQKAALALHNLINSQTDEKVRKRELRILKLLENVRNYTEAVRTHQESEFTNVYCASESDSTSSSNGGNDDRHPVQNVAHLMKLSFDELHRQAICQLGGIHAIAELVQAEHTFHGSTIDESHCILMRRYACMALTNLTFGDSGNKTLLCLFRDFMRALVVQLRSPSDELRQVTASVLRNLSWRADATSKAILREVGSVSGLMRAAMLPNRENTLKSILSALWNLSAHSTENKAEICAVEAALGFLVSLLAPARPLAIVENSGGVLRNVSSQVAVREDLRAELRRHACLELLLAQLRSPSLTVVSNACGTLWNLSAKCARDQEALWRLGAPAMLRSLNHSKHRMIAVGSSAALKNLLGARPGQALPPDATTKALDLPALPTLGARRQRALLQDLDQGLGETYENIEREEGGAKFKSRSEFEQCDEKDHCSIEDEDEDAAGYSMGGMTARKESVVVDGVNGEDLMGNMNVTKLELDEVDISEITVDIVEKLQYGEKQDVGKEKHLLLNSLKDNKSLDKTAPTKQIQMVRQSTPSSSNFNVFNENTIDLPSPILLKSKEKIIDKRIPKYSGLPRRVSPLRSITAASRHEANKVQNIDENGCSNNVIQDAPTKLSLESHQTPNPPKTIALNISLETNSSQTSDSPKMPDQQTKEPVPDDPPPPTKTCHVDNRMLDPNAMIESLDRFTAELVSQASSHLDHSSAKPNNATWDDDHSSCDVTFPSLTGTLESSALNDLSPSPSSSPPSPFLPPTPSTPPASLTQSTIVALEAEEAPKRPLRKRSLPRGLLVKRALNHSNLSSLGDLSWPNLETDNPPSLMADVFDLEGSFASVHSLPGDANSPNFKINAPVSSERLQSHNSLASLEYTPLLRADFEPNFHTHNGSSKENFILDNINPPSIYNEITDMCDSLADVRTEAIGTETEIFEDARSHVAATSDDLTTISDELYSDANSATPIQSDLGSSPEASPKRSLKARRSRAVDDRYKTYTVPVEVVREASNLGAQQGQIQKRALNQDRFQTHTVKNTVRPAASLDDVSEAGNYLTYTRSKPPDVAGKPRIAKPEEGEPEAEESRGIRGRRKPLYSKAAPKAIRTMTTNLVRNVASSLKTTPAVPPKAGGRPPVAASSGYGQRRLASPKVSPARVVPKLEKQDTFTRQGTRPKAGSNIPAFTKYQRSTSADNHRQASKLPTSCSSQSLKLPGKKLAVATTSKTAAARSGSNASIAPPGTVAKKQVTSKIASLWKKIEESKVKQQFGPVKKDTRVWIQANEANEVVMRNGERREGDEAKRVSRLGSFIAVDDAEENLIN